MKKNIGRGRGRVKRYTEETELIVREEEEEVTGRKNRVEESKVKKKKKSRRVEGEGKNKE